MRMLFLISVNGPMVTLFPMEVEGKMQVLGPISHPLPMVTGPTM